MRKQNNFASVTVKNVIQISCYRNCWLISAVVNMFAQHVEACWFASSWRNWCRALLTQTC